jgi:hypothetical protein
MQAFSAPPSQRLRFGVTATCVASTWNRLHSFINILLRNAPMDRADDLIIIIMEQKIHECGGRGDVNE